MGDYAEVVPPEEELKVSGPDYRYVLQITEMLEDTKVQSVWYMCAGQRVGYLLKACSSSLMETLHFFYEVGLVTTRGAANTPCTVQTQGNDMGFGLR